MNIDMSRFHQGFFDEVGEHLENLERLLLALDVAAPSRDDLDAIFRVAHSIKGGAGMFGFTEMAAFTHVLESLLQKVRTGEIAMSDKLVDLTLRAGDVLGGQLQHYRENSPLDPAAADTLVAELKAVLEGATVPATPKGGAVPEAPSEAPAPAAGLTRYRITFTCAQPEPARSSVHSGLRSALGALGELEVEPDVAAKAWTYMLRAACPEAELRDVFAFVQESGDVLEIAVETAPVAGVESAAAPVAGVAAAPAAARGPNDVPEIESAPDPFGFFDGAPGAPSDEPIAGAASAAPASRIRAGASPPTRAKSVDAGTIRVNLEKVDGLINLVGEMIIAQATLARVAGREGDGASEEMRVALEQIARHTSDLRESVMSIRMIPMSFVFSRFPRLIRDLAGSLGKKVSLVTVGDDTELDKGLIEHIVDPLTHLVRNSLDHGIESAEERVAAGKDPAGTITLCSSHQGGNVVIEVIDDGAGLDRERILAKARAMGLPVTSNMPDADVWQLVFVPGFSTAEVVTDVSGRGVGMDVVKRNITGVGGRVEITSQRGLGTHVTIRLPLTLAILDGLSVRVGSDVFIIPLAQIVESVQPDRESIKPVNGRGDVVHFRGEFIPVVRLHEAFGIERHVGRYEDGIFVVIEAEATKAAIFVDTLDAHHQVVIKSLETNFRKVDGIAGATSLGDGRVSLILDCESLLRIGGVVSAAA